MTDEKKTILTSATDEGEVMITTPDGRMVFMSFWEAFKFVVWATFQGYEVKVES